MLGRSFASGVLLGLLIGSLLGWSIASLVPRPTETRYVTVTSTEVQTVYVASGGQVTAPPQPPLGQGPFFHRIFSASSPDGLDWTFEDHLLLDHASVPAAIVTSQGRIRVYYVDASLLPETTNCADVGDGSLTVRVLGCTIVNRAGDKALDPSIVRLSDGRYRLYYYASASDPNTRVTHAIHSAISSEGVHFVEEREVFSYPGLVDPDVFWTGEQWLMFVFSLRDGVTIIASSKDGLNFQYVGPLNLKNWGTTSPVKIGEGRFRLYAFDQRTSKTVASFTSSDGLNWVQEPGVRLTAPAGERITDPSVIRLPDGTWRMIFKSESEKGSATTDAQNPCSNVWAIESCPHGSPIDISGQLRSLNLCRSKHFCPSVNHSLRPGVLCA